MNATTFDILVGGSLVVAAAFLVGGLFQIGRYRKMRAQRKHLEDLKTK